ncbi:MAG: sortase [Solirubrobacteraceae bacterium]|jgi:sortase A|nr:sortase [Solirubrobacteraceae bacterium]
MRRALRGLSTVLIISGLLLIADAGVTLAWEEPLTALIARLKQDSLENDLRSLERTQPTQLQLQALAGRTERRRIEFLARAERRRVRNGDALGRIKIGRIGASFVVVQGTDGTSLQKGPGHYPDTPIPGLSGTVAIAGHRTTYLAPFRHIDDLRKGDPIVIEMPYGKFTYSVERTRIVPPTEYSVVRRVGYDRLVLTACHPLYSAAKRIVVFARQVGVQARGAARVSG